MITRIEIDGFKSFVDFSLDVPPFLALVGPNSSGKSNLFDALAYIQESQVKFDERDALLNARRGMPQELFHRVAKGQPVNRFLIRVDSIVETEFGLVGIGFGAGAELEERVYPSQGDAVVPTPVATRGIPAVLGADVPDCWSAYRSAVGSGSTAFSEAISRDDADIDDAIYAAVNWLLLAPEPARMRSRRSTVDDRALNESGGNIAAVLGRLSGTEPFDDIVIDLAALIPGVSGLNVDLDEHRQEWSFDVVFEDEGPVSSTLLSDGTLRVLAVLTKLHDPKSADTLLIEELETGLHPSRLKELIRRIRQRVSSTYEPNAPLRQVIITSHSPVVVSELYGTDPDSLMFMDTVARVDPENERVSRVTRVLPVRSSGEPGTYISPREIRQYLGTVRGDER